jgi:hypothetical protein
MSTCFTKLSSVTTSICSGQLFSYTWLDTIVERIGLTAFARMLNGLIGEAADLSRRHKSDDSTLSSCTCSFEGY